MFCLVRLVSKIIICQYLNVGRDFTFKTKSSGFFLKYGRSANNGPPSAGAKQKQGLLERQPHSLQSLPLPIASDLHALTIPECVSLH